MIQVEPDAEATTLTIREHFAVMAMQGILANPEMAKYFKDAELSMDKQRRHVAEVSCEMAKAMIEELNKTTTP